MWIAVFLLTAIFSLLIFSMQLQKIRGLVAGPLSARSPGEIENRIAEMGSHGFPWHELEETEAKQIFSGSSLVSMMRLGTLGWFQWRVLGRVDLKQENTQLSLYDWMFSRRRPKGVFQTGFQSVMIATPTQPLDLPHFFLRPRRPMTLSIAGMQIRDDGTHDGLSCYPTVEIETHLTGNYMLESKIDYRARILFDTPLARDVMGPFVRDQNWTVEWTGTQLVVYGRDALVCPTQIKHFADDVIQLLEMLPAAQAAVNASYQQKIKAVLPSK